MDLVPLAMHCIRVEMRKECRNQLSVPQFRTLARLGRHPGASLSEIADHIGVALPTMSRIVDRLVERGLVSRQDDPDSRRRLALTLTTEGEARFEAARARTLERIAERLEALAAGDRLTIKQGLALLAGVLPQNQGSRDEGGR